MSYRRLADCLACDSELQYPRTFCPGWRPGRTHKVIKNSQNIYAHFFQRGSIIQLAVVDKVGAGKTICPRKSQSKAQTSQTGELWPAVIKAIIIAAETRGFVFGPKILTEHRRRERDDVNGWRGT